MGAAQIRHSTSIDVTDTKEDSDEDGMDAVRLQTSCVVSC